MKRNIKENVARRLAIILGQVRGIQEMVKQEKYCVHIITQIEAIREALSGIGDLVLQNHLETHIAHDMKHCKINKATKEILKIYRLAKNN